MNDGAKVFEVGVASLDWPRACRATLPTGASVFPIEACDCVRVCNGGVVTVESGEPWVKATDFGRPTGDGPGETDAFREKGLLRNCAMLQWLRPARFPDAHKISTRC
jgi:hypothetical protein